MSRILLFIALVPLCSFAGKAEREYLKSDVTPAITEAEAAFKTACGCTLKISLKEDSFKSTDDLYKAKHLAEQVKDNVTGYCTDKASKDAICKMKSLEFAKTTAAKFTFSGGRGLATTDGQVVTSWQMITEELDK